MIELDKVYLGNCMDIMPEILDGSIDLIVTSPPYNMACGKYKGEPKANQKQFKVYRDDMTEGWYKKFLFEFIRLSLQKSRYLALNIQYIVPTKEPIIYMMMEFKNELKDIFIWKKGALPGTLSEGGARLSTGWEFVFLFGKGGSRIFQYHNFPDNGYVPNIMEWHHKESFSNHHATFPLELPEFFIQHFTKEGDTVLDPFLGTGTTAVAATKLGRHFVGIDINPDYCDQSRQRVERVKNRKLTEWFSDAEN